VALKDRNETCGAAGGSRIEGKNITSEFGLLRRGNGETETRGDEEGPRVKTIMKREKSKEADLINPGYMSQIRDYQGEFDGPPPGPTIFCPKCRKPLGEGILDKFKTRCKHCGKWVLLEKKEGA
jgi:DNA-directed RNA polymerase subunit RPC12/RpoP